MKSLFRARGPWLAIIGTVAAIALTCATPAARAQPRKGEIEPAPIAQIPGGGTELFRALLDKEGIEPVRANDLWNTEANDKLIVILIGSVDPWNTDSMRWVRRVLSAGGAAFIATDGNLQVYEFDRDPNFNGPIGSFSGEIVHNDREKTHRDHWECPYAIPVSPDEVRPAIERPGRVWNVFRGLNKVATNSPTYINLQRLRGEYQYPLARLPKASFVRGLGRFDQPLLFAVGGDGPERWGMPGYSFLAVADSSVFINQMLMESGTDNLELTLRAIEYLQGPDKTRKKCIFFENGRVNDKFDGLRNAMAKPKPKIPPDAMPNLGPLFGKHQDKLIKFLDDKADELQTNDSFHKALVGQPGSSREARSAANWMEIAAVAGSIFIVLFLLRRMWGTRHPQNIPAPPNTGAGVASTGPPGVFDRRQKEMVRRNNIYEPVQKLMREFFAVAGAPPNPGPRMPPLEISDAVRKPESLRQAIRDMWRLAYGPPVAITAQRWFELEPYFDRLKQAHADGKWRFVMDEA